MSTLQPIYTVDNCRAAYQLNWSLSIFWKGPAAPADIWLDALISATEPDGVRILEHHSPRPNVSQFLLSTKPRLAPAMAVRSIKGRLQYIIRRRLPKPFRRNYSIHSVGSANVDAIEKYVAGQLERHPRADPSVRDRLAAFQFEDPDVDLASPRRSAHGEFIYSLHLAVVHSDRGVDVTEERLRTTHDMVQRIARKKGLLLSRASVLADHMHLTVGCDIADAPVHVVMAFMNNLAYAHHMKAVFQFGYYVGTFGPYDLQAVRRILGP